MRIKIALIIVGLLFLSGFTQRIGQDADPGTGAKVYTIRHFDCFPQKGSEAFCAETFKITIGEKPAVKTGYEKKLGEAARLTDELLSEIIRQTVLEPDKVIC